MQNPSCCLVAMVILCVLLCVGLVQPEPHHKVREIGSSSTIGFFCGEQIISAYFDVCGSRRRKRSSPVTMDRQDAKQFVSRQKRSSPNANIVEECCGESCAFEEIREYC
ncbi:predicted protein [Nematostella vectensis]|uniref:Insulin-like domain-containing protein n=2 Tax=Nematostella vectensis TaxID=45351 RepID=A7S6C3_NEMVE|nr:predicted protein [Nematostella vectensis]|eukprot:XP_001632788.1 predicted protein [Nematostella vectensis]